MLRQNRPAYPGTKSQTRFRSKSARALRKAQLRGDLASFLMRSWPEGRSTGDDAPPFSATGRPDACLIFRLIRSLRTALVKTWRCLRLP
jgi:hypothetical protein